MKLKHYGILGIVLFLITACGSSNAVQQGEASVVLTAAPTPTPIPTLAAAAPEVLPGAPPEVFASTDVVIRNSDFMLHLTRLYDLPTIGNFRPPAGKRYLLMEGILYNYRDVEQVFYDTDFQLNVANNLLPNTELMKAAQSLYYGGKREYPGRNVPLVGRFNLPANAAREIILVYELPETIHQMAIMFRPADLTPVPLYLWFYRLPEGEYSTFRVGSDGIPEYEAEWRILEEIQGEIHSSRPYVIANCRSEPLIREVMHSDISEESIVDEKGVKIALNTDFTLDGGGNVHLVKLMGDMIGDLSLQFADYYSQSGTYTTTDAFVDTITVAPGKVSTYSIEVQDIIVKGEVTIHIYDAVDVMPYSARSSRVTARYGEDRDTQPEDCLSSEATETPSS